MPKAAKDTKKPAAKGKAKPAKKETKKAKKKKDPNAPKKALSAYMFFCADRREKVKADNPEFKVTEVTSELGKQWATLSEADKKQFYDKAEKDKERYKKDMANYKPKKADEDSEEEEEEEEDEDSD
mmetsp:Transcript_33405/g.84664  ORF Transcript_33405/g.84664 Transcript_33405/m.84664 type:complete len:126 (-) Transcript_33405:678-1055(-)|eukprot:CAMPEP_0202865010 /NCGR_PEP_ID=MMETSP1391-20130828/5097_1 /ASSEMBLY_ACC=CAM_ASM_000867 /TAXON_ID=1034604 /ORGANISM="Chlamydomonas leiostraca, Strain SAG 11-49" /LENGTH=125 /DNA_ID=CAMNT_0049544795 /DNA_START=119 /DNA_END=496 /DNA_ORIENTATION=+